MRGAAVVLRIVSHNALESPFKSIALRVEIRIRETAIPTKHSITISRRLWLEHEICLADSFEEVCGPFIGDSLKLIGARFLDHAVEISESRFARSWSDRQ